MTFCANCGGLCEEPGDFCRKYGATRLPGVVTAANVVAHSPTETLSPGNAATLNNGLKPNIGGALSYLFGVVSGIAFLLLKPFRSDRFVKFHAWQSIFFTMAWIGLTIAWTVSTEIFEAVTGGFLMLLLIPIDCVLTLAGIWYWVFLMCRAHQGKQYKILLLGKLAEQRANK